MEIVNDFNCHSNIQLNPKKCEILKIGKDRNTEFNIQDPISKESNIIQCKDGTNVVRYLGIPLATIKIAKMKWCQNQLSKMHHKATKLSEAGLKITQLIAGIKRFILPMGEFLLRHMRFKNNSKQARHIFSETSKWSNWRNPTHQRNILPTS
jgi:hypothetical protein